SVTKWISKDPLGEAGGWNLTCFCGNDPVNQFDALGLALYAFDGTWNHPYATSRNGENNYITHVRRLYLAYESGARFYAFGIGSGYHANGTPYAGTENQIKKEMIREGVTGDSMNARVNYMIRNLETQLQLGDNIVDATGFSRGAASVLVFLNRIQDQIDKGNPLYKGIRIRFVGLFDTVPAIGTPALFKSTEISSGAASDFRFSLPSKMTFETQPVHMIALDEQRVNFQVTDLPGAWQIGFRGVHAEVGGWYPNDQFTWIPLKVMQKRAESAGVRFKLGALDRLIDRVPFDPKARAKDPDTWYYDEEQRVMPKGMLLHTSVRWYESKPENRVKAFPFFNGLY
ncbi:MAG: hypothetical protein EOM59_19645, partial [Clostridia bacterium]|nr:hypothetical protein [Clostridia bacterium]